MCCVFVVCVWPRCKGFFFVVYVSGACGMCGIDIEYVYVSVRFFYCVFVICVIFVCAVYLCCECGVCVVCVYHMGGYHMTYILFVCVVYMLCVAYVLCVLWLYMHVICVVML